MSLSVDGFGDCFDTRLAIARASEQAERGTLKGPQLLIDPSPMFARPEGSLPSVPPAASTKASPDPSSSPGTLLRGLHRLVAAHSNKWLFSHRLTRRRHHRFHRPDMSWPHNTCCSTEPTLNHFVSIRIALRKVQTLGINFQTPPNRSPWATYILTCRYMPT